jgi:hypothetical protein
MQCQFRTGGLRSGGSAGRQDGLGAFARGIDVITTHESFGTNQGSGRRPMPFNGRLAEAA